MATEMHATRWGDPAQAAPLPDSARALVELVFPLTEAPADLTAAGTAVLPAPGLPDAVLADLRTAIGGDHVHTDDESRRLRTRGKSTPDLLRARAGDLDDAPDAVVR